MLSLAALILTPLPLGTYFVGIGTGNNQTLTLKSGGRYDIDIQGCIGGSQGKGSFRITGDQITLTPEIDPATNIDPGYDHRFVIVPWAGRTYLVTPGAMPDFCDAYRTGWRGTDTPHSGAFFRTPYNLASDDAREAALPETPRVPSFWRSLLTRRLTAHVSQIKGAECRIDLGLRDGIDVGTVFGTDKSFVIVRKASEHESLCGWGTLTPDEPTDFRVANDLDLASKQVAYTTRQLEQSGDLGRPEFLPKTQTQPPMAAR